MGRNRKNITIQLNKRIDELLRIGEKKVKVDGRVDGIHSVQTAGCYRGTANRLGEVCKSMGIRSIEDIDKGVIERYMESYPTLPLGRSAVSFQPQTRYSEQAIRQTISASRNAVHTPLLRITVQNFHQQAQHTEQKIKMVYTLLLLLAAVARLSRRLRQMML